MEHPGGYRSRRTRAAPLRAYAPSCPGVVLYDSRQILTLVESLDLGPPSRPAGAKRGRLVAVAAGAVVIITSLAIYNNTRDHEPASSPAPSTTPTNQPLPTPSAMPTPTSSPSPGQQWRIRGFLDDTNLDLFARSDNRLYRIQTAKQLVTAIDTPASSSGGPKIFIVDRGQIIVRDWGDAADGFRVYDGKRPEALPEGLATPETIWPGPPGRLWVTTYRGEVPTTRLTDLEGRPADADRGPSSYPADAVQTDGRGGLILSSSGGYYVMTPNGPRRLTRGEVLAVGTSAILITDCDDRLRCSRYLLDRDTGVRRRIGPAPVNDNESGVMSRDGRYAVLRNWARSGSAELRILDLRTGDVLTRIADSRGYGDVSSLLWLPDDRLVGILDGSLFLYDPTDGKVTKPDLHLEGIQQLGLRAPT